MQQMAGQLGSYGCYLQMLLLRLYKKLVIPATKFGKRPVTVAQQRTFKILFPLPDDLILFHLLTDIGNDGLPYGFPQCVGGCLGLDERVHRMTDFSLHWRNIGE